MERRRSNLCFIAFMCLTVFLLPCLATASRLSISINPVTSGWFLALDGTAYLAGGPIAFHTSGQWYSNDGSIGQAMSQPQTQTEDGTDEIGTFVATTLTWKVAGAVPVETTFRVYNDLNAVLFEQHFPQGLPATNTSDRNSVLSVFPSFARDGTRGFLSYSGDFVKYTAAGMWLNETGKLQIASGLSAGPTLLFTPGAPENVILIAPYSEFMAASQVMEGDALQMGIMGSIESLPQNYSMKHLVYFGTQGIYETIQEWGGLMRQSYGKPERGFDQDFSVNWLGYNTDNGAYYYYLTEPGKTYEQTLLDVYEDSLQRAIPYRTILLDSWWYYKGEIGGVKNWTAMPSIFPNGLGNFYEKTQWNFIAHNRYWSGDTDYAVQNGGEYEFIIDPILHSAMPQDASFWDFLFQSSRDEWGLRTYEQDWLYNEFTGVTQALTNITVAKTWLTQMAQAAQRANITIQYCMPWPRHILSSVQFPAVTQIRASDDYQPGNEQWKLGYSGMLYQALGVAPFKDNFWTTQYQPGAPYKGDLNEPHTALESCVATLSTGPVTIGDQIGKSNRGLIMKSCREDGRLLKPDFPLHYTDSTVYSEAFGPSGGPWPEGFLFITNTSFIGGADERLYGWPTVLAVDLAEPYTFSLAAEFGQVNAELDYAMWRWTNGTSFLNPLPSVASLTIVPAQGSTTFAPCGIADFSAYYFAPFFPENGWTLLGEWTKWAPVSKQRILTLEWTATTITLELEGQIGELVSMAFAQKSPLSIQTAECTIGSSESITLQVQVGPNGIFEPQCQENSPLRPSESETIITDRDTIALE